MHVMTEQAKNIRLFIMDVDGVLTDGRVFVMANGETFKGFHTQDGQGLKMLQSTGVKLAIITGRADSCTEHRARTLGIDFYYAGIHDKREAFRELLAEAGLEAEACAYIGDDVIDLPAMTRVGLSISVPDAPSIVRQHAHYVTSRAGGFGAVREAAELIMREQGTLDQLIAGYLS
jgi:3-deoxy-D-manno-octulosonate 8-phosphate phosphatase (KDO 8-P phosphatase)